MNAKTNVARLLLWLLLALPVATQAQFTYRAVSGKITITGYSGFDGEVIIPDTIDGLPVTRISAQTFSGNRNLISVAIGNNVTSIDNNGFFLCYNLMRITIPSGVTSIGNNAFGLCALTEVIIPNSVASIGGGAFANCNNLTSVTIPNGVTSLGVGVFQNCSNQTNIIIGNAVTNINYYTFYGCTSLKSINVTELNSIYSSADGILFNKRQDTLIQCPWGWSGTYTIPNSVTTIRVQSFAQCRSLTAITTPNTVTNMGDAIFQYCTGLVHATITAPVTNMGENIFQGCSSLTSFRIPNTVTSIGYVDFQNCSSLTNVTIGNGVTFIEPQAFQGCVSLNGIYFAGDAPTFGSDVFSGVSNAKVYRLPEAKGWGATFASLPVVTWKPSVQPGNTAFGVKAGQFGFNVTGNSGLTFVVEAITDLAQPVWTPVSTNTLAAGTAYFSDPQWQNYPARLYRLRMP